MEEHDAVLRRDDPVRNLARVRIHDFRHYVSLFHPVVNIGAANENTCLDGFDVYQRVPLDKL